jgi:hypothetical protein
LSDLIAANRTLPAGSLDTTLNFFSLERLACTILLDYANGKLLDSFIGCEAFVTLIADASTANASTIVAGARIYHAIVVRTTMGTNHRLVTYAVRLNVSPCEVRDWDRLRTSF